MWKNQAQTTTNKNNSAFRRTASWKHLEDSSLMRLPLLRFGLLVLNRVCLRAYKNINGDEIMKIKCNYLLFGFIYHVSVEMLSMLRLIREPQKGQNH